jgi:hypothetical protein
MSHELEQFRDGSTAFVAGHNQDTWHQLGTVLPVGLTAEDVMTYAHLGGWNVRKREIDTTLLGPDGVTTTRIDGKYVRHQANQSEQRHRGSHRAGHRPRRHRRRQLPAVPERFAGRLFTDHDR